MIRYAAGVEGARWPLRPSKPLRGGGPVPGGFDSHALPPDTRPDAHCAFDTLNPADNHVHSEWSWDAPNGAMMESCRRAVELGLPSIAFTEHADWVRGEGAV